MIRAYFKHEATGKEFDVLKIDPAAGTITLKGATCTFDEPFDKEHFKRMGYELLKEEIPDAPAPPSE